MKPLYDSMNWHSESSVRSKRVRVRAVKKIRPKMVSEDTAERRQRLIDVEGERAKGEYGVESTRWYILAVFSMFSFLQCLIWFTFSSVHDTKVIAYYNNSAALLAADDDDQLNTLPNGPLDKVGLALLLNWGPIIGVAMFPFQAWLLTRKGGFQRATQLGSALVFGGALLRYLPGTFVSRDAVWLLHLGQVLNAAAGPLCMGTESRLSNLWFAENERATATAIAVTSNGVGSTVGFLLGPALVQKAEDFPHLLLVTLGLATIPFACSLVYYPRRPRRFPSPAAAALADDMGLGGGDGGTGGDDGYAAVGSDEGGGGGSNPLVLPGAGGAQMGFLDGLKETMRNRHYVVLVLAAGILAGVFAGWQSLFQDILGPLGYSDTQVGWIGFTSGLCGNLASVAVGFSSDKFFQRKFKRSILQLLGMLFVAVLWFTLSMPAFGSNGGLLPNSLATIGISASLAGMSQTGITPLMYELCAELTFPVSEGTSAGFLALIWNAASFVMIYLSPIISSGSINVITLLTVAVIFGMVTSVKEEYKRPTTANKGN